MWSNIKCRFLAIRALATDTAITEVVKSPLLQRVNKNFWTIWSKLSNKRRCPLDKTFRFGAMGHFSFLAFSSSAVSKAQNALMVYTFIDGTALWFKFSLQQWGHWWQHTFQLWTFLDLTISSMAFISHFLSYTQLKQQLWNWGHSDLIHLANLAMVLWKKISCFRLHEKLLEPKHLF